MNNKYENFISTTKTIMEENFIVEFLEDYEKADIQQKIDIYISQLEQYLKGYRNDLPNIIYEDRLFKEAWLGLAFSSDFTQEEFGSLVKTCFSQYSASFIIMSMKQKDVEYLECVLENIPITPNDKKAIKEFESTLEAIRKTSNEEHNLKFSEDLIIGALKVYLLRHEKYLSDPSIIIESIRDMDEYGRLAKLPLTEVVLYNLKCSIPESIYKLRKYLPLLPQANETEEVFSIGTNLITEININKSALINKYQKLLTNEDIHNTCSNLFEVLNNAQLSGITSIVYNNGAPKDQNQINLLFVFSSVEKLNNKDLINFLYDILDIYCENYSVVDSLNESEKITLQKSVNNCWLDAKLPHKHIEKSIKIKI